MLVASPADCREERKLIPGIIADWNAVNSLKHAVVLQPVLWETHARSELGDRAQGIINKQILSMCDFLVGIFWTRLGTPTGTWASGTAEEIEEFRSRGKQVLLYFSTAPIPQGEFDPDQYKALRSYRAAIEKNGLVFSFNGQHDFDQLLRNHLGLLMNETLASNSPLAEVKISEELLREATSKSELEVLSALHELRTHTKFLWLALKELSPYKEDLTAEIKEETFQRIQPALDVLVRLGHLTYDVKHAYDMLPKKSPVLSITARHITTQLRNLVRIASLSKGQAHPIALEEEPAADDA
jgi:hypothetical protein